MDTSGLDSQPAILYVIVFTCLWMVIALWRTRHVGVRAGMAVVVLAVAFSRTVFWDYAYETLGEGSFYIELMTKATIPMGVMRNPPGVFSLFFFSHQILGFDPVVVLKFWRITLGSLNVLMTYLIAERFLGDRRLGLGCAVVLAFSELQMNFLEGDEFKNLLGQTFFLASILVSWDLFEAGRRSLRTAGWVAVLGAGMVLSHYAYTFLFMGLTALVVVTKCVSHFGRGREGRHPGVVLMLAAVAVSGAGYWAWSSWVRPGLDIEGLGYLTLSEYAGLGLLDEVTRLGLLSYNVMIVLAAFGCAASVRRKGVAGGRVLVIAALMLLTTLAKQYLVGAYFQPVRFLVIDAPFLAVFSVYGLAVLVEKLGWAGRRLWAIGVSGFAILGLALTNWGGKELGLVGAGLALSVGESGTVLFGGGGALGESLVVLGLDLAVLLLVSMASVRGSHGPSPAGRVLFERHRLVGIAAAVTGAVLGLVNLLEPSAMAAPGVRTVALPFVGVALGAGLAPLLPAHMHGTGSDARLIIGAACGLALSVIVWYAVLLIGSGSTPWAGHWATTATLGIPAVGWLGWRRDLVRRRDMRAPEQVRV